MSKDKKEIFEEKTLEQKELFAGKIIHVHIDTVSLPDNKTAKREVVDHVGGVCIAALTEENELLFVKQYRYPYKKVLLELPAGKLDNPENPLKEGMRELREETGAIGENYIDFGVVYPSPGFSSEKLYLYFCNVKTFHEPSPDEGEFIEIEKISLEKSVEMVMKNQITDAKTQIGILKTYNYIKSIKD